MIYRTLGILLVVLTVATAMAQKPVTHFEVEQCETLEFSVVDWPGDEYTWDLYTELQWDTVNFAHQKGNVDPAGYFDKGMYRGSTVTVHWLDPGRYFLRVMVWDEVSCTNNLLVFTINVLENKPEATIVGDSLCYGDPVVFKIILTGLGPWDLKYTYGDGTAVLNMNGVSEPEQTVTLPPLPVGTTEVWVQEIIDQCTSNLIQSEKGRIVIFPIPTNSKIYPVKK
jgi:hypothetical protein